MRGRWEAVLETAHLDGESAPAEHQVVALEVRATTGPTRLSWRGLEADLLADAPIFGILDRDFVVSGGLVEWNDKIGEQALGPARACVVPGGTASIDCYDRGRIEVWVGRDAIGSAAAVRLRYITSVMRRYSWEYASDGVQIHLELGESGLQVWSEDLQRFPPLQIGPFDLEWSHDDELLDAYAIPEAIHADYARALARHEVRRPRFERTTKARWWEDV